MDKQDRQGVRTPADVERKYNLGRLAAAQDSSAEQNEQIERLSKELAQFIADTNGKFQALDRNTETFFYSGVPTLTNAPAVNWNTNDAKSKHIGDLYYNADDGSLYVFKGNGTSYEWVQCSTGSVVIVEQEKIVDVTENGTIEILPDEEKTLAKVTVNVDVQDDIGVEYTSVVYNNDNTITLTDIDGNTHTMECEYTDVQITSVKYGGKSVGLTYDEGNLVKVGGTTVDVSNAPVSSGGGTEAIEQLIEESGVLDTEGTVTEKVEQLIDKAEDENMWYGHILANISNSTMFSRLFANYPYSQLPRVDLSGATSFLYYFANAKITSIDYYLDTPNLTNCNYAFQGAKSLKSIKGINTSKVTSVVNMFNSCVIETIEMPFNFSSVTNTTNAFWCSTLKNVKFVVGTIKVSIAFSSPILTTESIQSIIDGLATVTTAQTLTLNKAIVLTDEQKSTIQTKGWTLVQ